MVVCKFFLQGCCRFGNNCNYEHPRSQGYQQPQQQNRYQPQSFSNQAQDQNKYKFVANSNQPSQTSAQPTNLFSKLVTSSKPNVFAPTQLDSENISNDQEFLELITSDIKSWINSSAWKLSCYSYSKSAPCLPILTDISPEEVRYSVYEAKKVNRFSEEFQQFQQKQNQVVDLLNQIANPNQEMRDYLLKYFHESRCKTPTVTDQKPNPFMQIIQNKQQQMLQQQPQPVQAQQMSQPQPAQPQFLQSKPTQPQPFGQIQPQPFGQTQQQLFQQQNIPVQNFLQGQQTNLIQTSGSFLFTNQNQQVNTPQDTNRVNPFTQLIGGPNSGGTASSISMNSNNVSMNFNQSQVMISSNEPSYFYSLKSDLKEQDIQEFKENKFTICRIPHVPPPKELCFL